jgi:hypothetical protein
MSQQRSEKLQDLIQKSGCPVKLIDPSNLQSYILANHPLHEGYAYLSETHKADYLRTYCMHFHGGGYSDIKTPGGDWNKGFDDINARDDCVLNGYHEEERDHVAGDEATKDAWKELPGNGSYIVRPNTQFTREWYTSLLATMDTKLAELKAHPATSPQAKEGDGTGYPIRWTEILGEIFHPLCAKYRKAFLFSVPKPVCHGYR